MHTYRDQNKNIHEDTYHLTYYFNKLKTSNFIWVNKKI